jgi:uncharacterized RDD family membrane protein YckC
MHRQFFKYFAYSIFIVFIANGLGSFFGWYSLLPWYDTAMHVLGGFTLGWFYFALFFNQAKQAIVGKKTLLTFLSMLAFVFVVAFMWEVFEFCLQGFLQIKTLASPIDSVHDLIAGLAGGIVSFLFAIKKIRQYV